MRLRLLPFHLFILLLLLLMLLFMHYLCMYLYYSLLLWKTGLLKMTSLFLKHAVITESRTVLYTDVHCCLGRLMRKLVVPSGTYFIRITRA